MDSKSGIRMTMESEADERAAIGSNPIGALRPEGQDLRSPP